MSGPVKTVTMLASIVLDLLIPQAESLSFLIRYFLMGMLFFAFLDIELNKEVISTKHLFIILYLVVLSLTLFYSVSFINTTLALALFVSAIAPTAISASPIIGYLKGNVGYVTFSVLSTNIVIAVILPFLLPLVITTEAEVRISQLLFPVLSTMFIPLGVAFLVRKFFRKTFTFFKSIQQVSFFFFTGNIFLAMSSASHFISNEYNGNFEILLILSIGIALLTALNFTAGWFMGSKNLARETSNSVGQKNTMFAIWIALTFINPVIALGPMMYTIFHNLFVSYQLYSSDK